ncbi:hypothetical protein ACKKBG_A32395 [Auxenochlorella protothecoides x Auxenochlorella symbiontica]
MPSVWVPTTPAENQAREALHAFPWRGNAAGRDRACHTDSSAGTGYHCKSTQRGWTSSSATTNQTAREARREWQCGGTPFQRNTSCIHGADLVARDGSIPADLVTLQSMIDDGVILLPYPLQNWPQRNINERYKLNEEQHRRSNIERATLNLPRNRVEDEWGEVDGRN